MMRSEFADKFNHDDDAADYDEDVLNEQDPIRTGYAELLKWVASRAEADATSIVVDLGCGTGNLSLQLQEFGKLRCVDTSQKMLQIAQVKLRGANNVEFIQADILEYFTLHGEPCDRVVSTYAVHHLTESEKSVLFEATRQVLKPGGVAVFGDLMFQSEAHRAEYLNQLRTSGKSDLADVIEDEFFWDVEWSLRELEERGFAARERRFSDLSWGIVARLEAKGGEKPNRVLQGRLRR